MRREVDAPEQDYLTAEEAAKWLRIDVEDFLEFVRMGTIPHGIAYGKTRAKQRWPWLDLVAVGHLLARGFLRLPGSEEK